MPVGLGTAFFSLSAALCVDGFRRYLSERRYARHNIDTNPRLPLPTLRAEWASADWMSNGLTSRWRPCSRARPDVARVASPRSASFARLGNPTRVFWQCRSRQRARASRRPRQFRPRWASSGSPQRHDEGKLRRNPPRIADQEGEIPRSRRTLPYRPSEQPIRCAACYQLTR